MNNKYIFAKDLTIVFATLFLGTSIFHSLTDNKFIAMIFISSTLIPTLVGMCFMVIFRNEKQV